MWLHEQKNLIKGPLKVIHEWAIKTFMEEEDQVFMFKQYALQMLRGEIYIDPQTRIMQKIN